MSLKMRSSHDLTPFGNSGHPRTGREAVLSRRPIPATAIVELASRSCRLNDVGLMVLCCSPVQPQGALTFGQLAPLKWLAMRLLPSA